MTGQQVSQLRRRQPEGDVQLPAEMPALLRRLYHLRGITAASELERGASALLPWQALNGIESAAALLHQAILSGQRIVVVGDFDADGATSTALSLLALRAMGTENVTFLVPNRFEDGYGLSPEVVEQAKTLGAELILTVDNGISSHAGVALANQYGIPVVITDHHLPGDTLQEAAAIVKPNLTGCSFPSRALDGVRVAFYQNGSAHV